MLALCFQVGTARMAVDVRRVLEVVPRVQLTPLSGGHELITGHFVYRGRIVPVIDLFHHYGFGVCPPHLSSRIILFAHPEQPDQLMGLLATQVADIRDIPNAKHDGTIADGSTILTWFQPDTIFRLLAQSHSSPYRTGS